MNKKDIVGLIIGLYLYNIVMFYYATRGQYGIDWIVAFMSFLYQSISIIITISIIYLIYYVNRSIDNYFEKIRIKVMKE